MRQTARLLLGFALVTPAAGCGGPSATDTKADLRQQASGRLEAMKSLAEAVSRNAPASELNGHIEGLISNSLDPVANPVEARELVNIYTTKIKGKLKGDQAITVKGIVDSIEAGLKS